MKRESSSAETSMRESLAFCLLSSSSIEESRVFRIGEQRKRKIGKKEETIKKEESGKEFRKRV